MYKKYEVKPHRLFTNFVVKSKPNNQELINKYKDEAEKQGLLFLLRIKNGVGFYLRKDCGHCFEYQITAVRNSYLNGSNVKCSVCLTEYKKKICKDKRVQEIAVVKPGTYLFRRTDCGHEVTACYDVIASAGFCAKCKAEELEKIANEKGLISIGRNTSLNANVYLLPCGHTKAIVPSLVKNNGWRCVECYEDNIKTAMIKWGYEYIGMSDKSPHYRLAKFKDCGHYKDVQVHDLTGRPVKGACKICIEIKHKKEAIDNDLVLLGNAENNNPNYRKYKLNCCGGEGDLMVTHVRRGNFTCPCCGDSAYSHPSNLYLLRIVTDKSVWLKFGFSKDVQYRISCYGLTNCKADVLKTVEIPTGSEAVRIEKSIHKKMKMLKIDNSLTKDYFSVSGFNECYPYAALDIFLKEMEKHIVK